MRKPRSWSWLLLFTTSGTLLCCAIPITLVSLGLGATVATMVSSAPWIITLSQYKGWMFLLSGVLIGLSVWRNNSLPLQRRSHVRCGRCSQS